MRMCCLLFLAPVMVGGVLVGSVGSSAAPARATVPGMWPATRQVSTADPVIAAAGDIACDPGDPDFNNGDGIPNTPNGIGPTLGKCRQKYTADLLPGVDAVLPLGDTQYVAGASAAFAASYNPSWGISNSIAHPVVGNHEYTSMAEPNAGGYFAYFGSAAGDPTKGYYSWDLGAWHMIALNSECAEIGGCDAGSPEELWLKADLQANTKPCIIAYQHRARFSSGDHGNNGGSPWSYDAFWRDLYAAGADIFLSGHDHDYERFSPQNPDQQVDPNGIRQFVVGTGGANLVFFGDIQPNTEIRDRKSFGVLKLTLHPTTYDWQFVPEVGSTFVDSGSRTCLSTPTAVGMRQITALNAKGGGIHVRWRTATETSLVGFIVYRERNGKRTRLNRGLIPARGGVDGHAYTWLDSQPPKGTLRYWVASVDIEGHTNRFGSVTVVR